MADTGANAMRKTIESILSLILLPALAGCAPQGSMSSTMLEKTTVTVKREGNTVWIDGIKGFSPAEYASSPHGCQTRILQTLGEKISYDDLICWSGFAFRIEVHEQMCPSAGHPCCGFMCMEGSSNALPWRTSVYDSNPRAKPAEDRAAFESEICMAIKASIDRGVPVHYGSEEDGLIIGYADDGQRWRCIHPYHKWGAEAFWHDEADGFAGGKWPWGIIVWTQPKPAGKRASGRELTAAALKQAVEMWNAEKRNAYFCGDAAYAHWLTWLKGVESGKVADPKSGMQGNGWCFDVLIHSRRIASRWLDQRASEFDAETAAQMRFAAEHYAQIAETCMTDLMCPWDLALSPERFTNWNSPMRLNQIARLESAREHDRSAIAAIRLAIETLEKASQKR